MEIIRNLTEKKRHEKKKILKIRSIGLTVRMEWNQINTTNPKRPLQKQTKNYRVNAQVIKNQ